MRPLAALAIGLVLGLVGGLVGASAFSGRGGADGGPSEADDRVEPDSAGGLRAGTGDRAPLTRAEVAAALPRVGRAASDGGPAGPRVLVALATLEAVAGDEAAFLRLAERALANGLRIDDLLEAIAERPAERRAGLLLALLDRHPDAVGDAAVIAGALADAGRPDRALTLAREALPREGAFRPELARVLLRLDPEGAARSLYDAEGSNRWTSDDLDALRSVFIQADQEKQMVRFLERILDTAPSDHDALRALRKVDPGAADARLRALVARSPDDATAWSLLGDLRREAGDVQGAFDAFRRAAERDPRRSSFRDLLAADPVRGLEVVVALAKGSTDDEMLGALGEMYALAGRKDDAIRALLSAHEHDPKDLEWIDRLVELDPAAATGLVAKRVAEAGASARDDLLGRYGDALRAAGRAEDAFAQYVAANRRNPDADEWQRALAELDPRAALPLLEAHVRARPSDASGHGNYGVALAAAGRGAEATSHLERALAQGGDPRRWYDALRTLDATRALDGLDRRARAEAENDRTWALLGKELRAAGRAAEARAAYEQAARLDPANRDWARALRDLK